MLLTVGPVFRTSRGTYSFRGRGRDRMSPPSMLGYTKHADSRVNIPTQELGGFVAKEEQAPYDLLNPRDPSHDPQLVWKGQDELDDFDLVTPALAIYIQEKSSHRR